MPSWTLGDIVSTATIALGNRTDITLSQASLAANQAQLEVWSQLPFDEQESLAISSTTVNEDKVTLPSDFQELLVVSNMSANQPHGLPMDPLNLDQLEAFSQTSGVPRYYTLYDSYLELRPIPDSACSIQLRYRKQLSDMVETTEVPSVSTRYRMAVYYKTKEILAEEYILDSEAAALAHNKYISYMASMPSDRALKNREGRAHGLSLPRRRGQKGTSSSYSFDRSIK